MKIPIEMMAYHPKDNCFLAITSYDQVRIMTINHYDDMISICIFVWCVCNSVIKETKHFLSIFGWAKVPWKRSTKDTANSTPTVSLTRIMFKILDVIGWRQNDYRTCVANLTSRPTCSQILFLTYLSVRWQGQGLSCLAHRVHVTITQDWLTGNDKVHKNLLSV